MSMQSPLSDFLTQIRNAQAVHKLEVRSASSKLKLAILEVLESEGYIRGFQVSGDKKKEVAVFLKYFNGEPVIRKIQMISKPSLQVYRHAKDLPVVMNGLGVAIVSTSKGVMSAQKAKALGQGGEVLCEVA